MKRWLDRRKLLVHGSVQPHLRPTHLGFDGWKACITQPQDLRDFAEQYVRMLYEGQPLFVVEQKSDPFPLFFDLDNKTGKPLCINHFCETVHKFLASKGAAKSVLFVLKRPDTAAGAVRTQGFHVHVPKVFVTKATALQIRSEILQQLGGDWPQIVDIAVYKNAGLRMPGSRKPGDQPKIYAPHSVYPPNNKRMKLFCTDLHYMLSVTTVRTNRQETTPLQMPLPPPPIPQENTVVCSSNDAAQFRAFGRWLELRWPCEAVITKISKVDDSLYFVNTNCKYCMNKLDYHGNSTVWFMVTQRNIKQRCFSPKSSNGILCSSFHSRPWCHTSETYETFFGSSTSPSQTHDQQHQTSDSQHSNGTA